MPLPRKPLPFGEWRPDVALLDVQFSSIAENVYAGPNSYLPFPGLGAASSAQFGYFGNDEHTKVLLHFTGADAGTVITDDNAGGSAHTWTCADNANTDTAQFKFSPPSLACDGTLDCVRTPDHADFTLGAGDFTIEFWFKVNSSDTQMYAAGQCENFAISPVNGSFVIYRHTDNTMIAAVIGSDGIGYLVNGVLQFTTVINPGWHHYRLIRTSGFLTQFIDGVQDGAATAIGVSVRDSAFSLAVGAAGDHTLTPWNGWIDEFRLDVGIARSAVDFTVPVEPYAVLDEGPAVGLTYARLNTGAYVLYAGTPTNLYRWTGTAWTNVSGSTYSVADGDRWSFAQFGPHLIAVQIGDPPQVINVDIGTNFANLAGSPPTASSVAVIGDFLVLARGEPDANPANPQRQNMIQWSGINDIENWTVPFTENGGAQVFPDGGPVIGVAGGEVGFVLQDKSIRSMQFLPGDTTITFSFSRVEREKGCIGKSAFCFTRGVLFLLAEDGFFGLGVPNPAIGDHIVNQWFLDHSDPARRAETQCFADPGKPHVMWAFYSSATATYYDRLLIYDWSLNRWTYSTQGAQIWASMASPQFDLDTDVPGDALDIPLDSSRPSLDSTIYQGGRPIIAAIDVNGRLSFLNGANLAATIETSEAHLSPGMRTFVSGAYPLVDAAEVAVAVGEREQLQIGTSFRYLDPPLMGLPVESTGSAPVYSSSRLHRFRVFVPAAAPWTHALGVVVEAQPDGEGY